MYVILRLETKRGKPRRSHKHRFRWTERNHSTNHYPKRRERIWICYSELCFISFLHHYTSMNHYISLMNVVLISIKRSVLRPEAHSPKATITELQRFWFNNTIYLWSRAELKFGIWYPLFPGSIIPLPALGNAHSGSNYDISTRAYGSYGGVDYRAVRLRSETSGA